eukprot:GHVT01090139.1.p1 GENE.GHVT01090139.1~~GHVT01090139.1.p1  ORF type:complete len:669 (+),score=178.99 GHVT01090139.1:456-2462(+)
MTRVSPHWVAGGLRHGVWPLDPAERTRTATWCSRHPVARLRRCVLRRTSDTPGGSGLRGRLLSCAVLGLIVSFSLHRPPASSRCPPLPRTACAPRHPALPRGPQAVPSFLAAPATRDVSTPSCSLLDPEKEKNTKKKKKNLHQNGDEEIWSKTHPAQEQRKDETNLFPELEETSNGALMVGIETHAQLLTSSKLLCPCKRLPSASPLWHRVGAPLAQAPASLAAACALPSPAAAAPTATATATATAPSHSALNGEASASNGEASALNGEASALNGEASALNGEASALNGEASAAACGGGSPSASFCPICTGEPGALPLLNRRAVELAVKAALALNCSIASEVEFDRKLYFYPDTPKGYQTTQFRRPLGRDGFLRLPSCGRRVGIRQVHLEEDAAKMEHRRGAAQHPVTAADRAHHQAAPREGQPLARPAPSAPADHHEDPHAAAATCSSLPCGGYAGALVDFRRSGVPLVEIVTEPDLRTAKEAAEYCKELARVLQFAGVCDVALFAGSFRCDVNVSLPVVVGRGERVQAEVKNLNSFSAVRRCVAFEAKRLSASLAAGHPLWSSETRTWDARTGTSRFLRSKGRALPSAAPAGASPPAAWNYRYQPEPDIPPVPLPAQLVARWKAALPELPSATRIRYSSMGLSSLQAFTLTEDRESSEEQYNGQPV